MFHATLRFKKEALMQLIDFSHNDDKHDPDRIKQEIYNDPSFEIIWQYEQESKDEDLGPVLAGRIQSLLDEEWSFDKISFEDAQDEDLSLMDVLPARARAQSFQNCELKRVPDLAGLEELTLPINGQQDLSQISSCSSLAELTLEGSNDEVIELPPLPSSLRKLTLFRCAVKDLSPLAQCPDLSYLFLRLRSEPASCLAPLAGLTSLSYLMIYSEKGKLDGSPLAGLTSLEDLNLTKVKLKPATLEGLISLKKLCIHDSGLKDLLSLKNAAELEELNVGAPVTSLEGIEGMTKLRVLALYATKVTSLAPALGAPLETLSLPDVAFDLAEVDALLPRAEMCIEFRDKRLNPAKFRGLLDGSYKPPTFADTARPAYLPKMGKKADVSRSHYGGGACLAPGEQWPACGHCGKPMKLFLQLDLAMIPDEERAGLLQLFYCTSSQPLCEVECESFSGKGDAHLLRILTDADAAETAPPKKPKPMRQKNIIDFVQKKDHPSEEDAEHICDLDRQLYREKMIEKDKALGWPSWIQGAEWPKCETCGERMTALYQLESDKALDHGFGDNGRAHLFTCRAHPEQTHFLWQCY